MEDQIITFSISLVFSPAIMQIWEPCAVITPEIGSENIFY